MVPTPQLTSSCQVVTLSRETGTHFLPVVASGQSLDMNLQSKLGRAHPFFVKNQTTDFTSQISFRTKSRIYLKMDGYVHEKLIGVAWLFLLPFHTERFSKTLTILFGACSSSTVVIAVLPCLISTLSNAAMLPSVF